MEKTASNTDLKRKLNSRQLSMIAIGGSLGTGIFLASGNALSLAGPGGVLTAYLITGCMVFFLMSSLAEMSAFMPSTGSFYLYAAKFVDPALGYALGWNYWYNWAITMASEISAASLVMHYWFPDVPSYYWSGLFLTFFVAFNALSVKGFGEAEFWFSFVKVATILVFIILGIALILGFNGHPRVGFKNWYIGDGPFHGGWFSIFGAFIIAGFSFQGTELIAITAGECKNPRKTIPRAIKHVFFRILLFFVFSIGIISLLIPYTAPELLSSDVSLSPFTLIFSNFGISFAASIMNAVILTAILSAGNSGMYAATRMLWFMSKAGHAPSILSRVNQRGVPIYALGLTTIVAFLTFLASFFGAGSVYFWLLSASSLSGFIAWLGIAISHYRFRKAYLKNGLALKDLPYVAKGYPYAPLLTFALCLIVIAGQNYQAFLAEQIDWYGVVVSYIGLPVFVGLWLGYKIKHKTQLVKLLDCDFANANS